MLVYPVRRNHATSNNPPPSCDTLNNVEHTTLSNIIVIHIIRSGSACNEHTSTCEFHVRILCSEARGGHGNPTLLGWDYLHSQFAKRSRYFCDLAGRVSADGPLRLGSIEPQLTSPLCRVSHVIRKIANLSAAWGQSLNVRNLNVGSNG